MTPQLDQLRWVHPTLSGMEIVDRHLSEEDYLTFKNAVEEGNETDVHGVLSRNPIIFEPILERVGHHAMWFKNKPEIRPTLTNGKPGQIPDCLLAGKGSGGIEWFIVELKSPQEKLFSRRGGFSSCANKALDQLARYMIYANEKQGTIRDAFEIRDFKNPRGIFVIGRSGETDNEGNAQSLKAFWNNQLNGIQIISYDRLLRNAQTIFERQ